MMMVIAKMMMKIFGMVMRTLIAFFFNVDGYGNDVLHDDDYDEDDDNHRTIIEEEVYNDGGSGGGFGGSDPRRR